jgi:hypothetical protein
MIESQMLESKEDIMLVSDIGGDTMELCLQFIYGASLDGLVSNHRQTTIKTGFDRQFNDRQATT